MTDVIYADQGSVVQITPVSPAAKEWIDDNVASEGWQWLGRSLCIDWRYGALLLADLEDAGFVVDGAH